MKEFEPRIHQPFPVQIQDYEHETTLGLPATRFETMAECRNRILADIRRQFEKDYWPEIETFLKPLVPASKRDKHMIGRNFAWYHLYQEGRSCQSIELDIKFGNGFKASTICKCIHNIAKEYELPLRSSKTRQPANKMHHA